MRRGALAARVSGYNPKIALAFYIWTEHLAARKLSLAAGMREMMSATRRAGYRRVEIFGTFFARDTRAATLAALEEFQFGPPMVYKTGIFHESAGAEKAIAEALEVADVVKPLGTTVMTVNPTPRPRQERKSDEELRTQARYVGRGSAACTSAIRGTASGRRRSAMAISTIARLPLT